MKNRVLCFILLASLGVPVTDGIFPSALGSDSDDPVVATVNGVTIKKSRVTSLIDEYKQRTHKSVVSADEKRQILQGLVRRYLILQQKETEEIRKDEKIARQVEEFENQLVITAYLKKHVGKHLVVNDEEMKAYYQKNLLKFSSPPKVKAKHILLRNRKEAEMVMAKLQQGQKFGQLAKEYSIDLPRAREGEGGSMGVIEKGRTLPELEKALFILKVGEISDIVETPYGFHILTVDEIITTEYRSFEEVKEDIRKIILQQKEAKAFEEMVAKLEKKSDVKIHEDQLVQSNLQ